MSLDITRSMMNGSKQLALRDTSSLKYFNTVIENALKQQQEKIILKKVNATIKKYKGCQGLWKGEIIIDNQIKVVFSPYYLKGSNEANYTQIQVNPTQYILQNKIPAPKGYTTNTWFGLDLEIVIDHNAVKAADQRLRNITNGSNPGGMLDKMYAGMFGQEIGALFNVVPDDNEGSKLFFTTDYILEANKFYNNLYIATKDIVKDNSGFMNGAKPSDMQFVAGNLDEDYQTLWKYSQKSLEMVKNVNSRYPSTDASFIRLTGQKREPEDIVLNKAVANIGKPKDKVVTKYKYDEEQLINDKVLPRDYFKYSNDIFEVGHLRVEKVQEIEKKQVVENNTTVIKEFVIEKDKKFEGHLMDRESIMMYFGNKQPNNRHVIRVSPQIVYGCVNKTQPDKNKVVWRVKSKITIILKSLPKLKSVADQLIDENGEARYEMSDGYDQNAEGLGGEGTGMMMTDFD